MMIFICKVLSFTWNLNFFKASVCAKIDKNSRELSTGAHEQSLQRGEETRK